MVDDSGMSEQEFSQSAPSWGDVPVDSSISGAPLPTPRTIRMRRNLLIQAWRFVLLNARMARLAMKGHK